MASLVPDAAETSTVRHGQRFWARVLRFLSRFETSFDRVLWGLRKRYGRLGPLQILAFRGYGDRKQVVVRGRVLEASVLERSLPNDSRLQSIRRMLRRFNSQEVPEATVTVRMGGREVSVQTDDEGYFDVALDPAASDAREAWSAAEVEVVACPVRGLANVKASAEVLVVGETAELGVISDIDDTVLQTHVTQRWKMLWVTLSGNPFTRMPFEGTSELYGALAAGASGTARNPVFYVSKSPWNLYDFLVDFMDYHELPRGPLLLRDIGLREAPPLDHKAEAVRQLLKTYRRLPFILIGDSGERDADIYVEAAEHFPGRVRAIYIRDLGGKSPRGDTEELRARARVAGAQLLWVAHAREALEHARSLGIVRRPALPATGSDAAS